MLTFRRSIMMVITLLIMGCSSQTELTTQRYLLTAPTHVAAFTHHKPAYPVIKLQEITVSDYLDDTSIAVVTRAGQVHKAIHYQWAEPLHNQLEDLSLQRLNQRLPDIKWLSPHITSSQINRLDIFVAQFHCDENGHITIAGQWSLWNSVQQLIAHDTFHYTATIAQDGYLAMTQQLALTWINRVTDGIAKHIAVLPPVTD